MWKFQNQIWTQCSWFDGETRIFHTDAADWKYSETTPGYRSSSGPYPCRKFIRGKWGVKAGRLHYYVVGLDYSTNPPSPKRVDHFGDFALGRQTGDSCWGADIGSAVDRAQKIAFNQANQKVEDQQIDLSVVFGELPETCGMLLQDARRIIAAAKEVKQGNFRNAARQLSIGTPRGLSPRHQAEAMFADNWLKYQYGYKPIVQDMVNGAIAVCKKAREKRMIYRATGSSTCFATGSRPERGIYLAGGGYIYTELVWKDEYQAHVLYIYEVTSPGLAAMSALGLTNPLSTGWELIRFSFIADWFANFGQCLSGLDTWVGKQFLSGCLTTCHRPWRQIRSKEIIHPPSGKVLFSENLGVLDGQRIDRNPLSSAPPTRLVSNLPDSVSQLATTLSLMSQIFRGK